MNQNQIISSVELFENSLSRMDNNRLLAIASTPKKRFLIWAAVSSEEQAEKISLDDQVEQCRAVVEKYDGIVVHELRVAQSRSIIEFSEARRTIPQYETLYQAIINRAVDVIIYWDSNRLGHTDSLVMSIFNYCQEKQIVLFEVTDPQSDINNTSVSFSTRVMSGIKSNIAQEQIAQLQRAHEKGMKGRALAGKMIAKPAFGYTYDPNSLERQIIVVESEAIVVKRIFREYLSGAGTHNIANGLNSDNVPSPDNKQWKAVNVRSIISKRYRYAGFSEVNAYHAVSAKKRATKTREYTQAPGNWQPIISLADCEAAGTERIQRVANRRIPDTPYLLSGVCRCNVCGRHLRINKTVRKRTSKRVQMSLYCPNRGHGDRFVSYQKVLEILRFELKELGNRQFDESDEEDSIVEQIEQEIERHEKALSSAEKSLDRADTALVRGNLDEDRHRVQADRIKAEIMRYKSEIGELEDKAQRAVADGTRRDRIAEVRGNWEHWLASADATEANAWLRRHITIWIEDHNVARVEYL